MGPLVRARVTKGSCLLCERTSRRTQPAGIPFNSSTPSRNVHQVAEMISSASALWSSSALPGDAVPPLVSVRETNYVLFTWIQRIQGLNMRP